MSKFVNFVCILVLAIYCSGTFASTNNQTTNNNVLRVFNSNLVYPYPFWFANSKVGEARKNKTENLFSFLQVPDGQSLEYWKEMYAINGYRNNKKYTGLASFIISTFNEYTDKCGKDNFILYTIDSITNEDDNVATYLMFCGDIYATERYDRLYRNGLIGVFKFIKSNNAYIKVSQEWKVNAFDVKQSSFIKNISVNFASVQDVVKAFNSIQYFYTGS